MKDKNGVEIKIGDIVRYESGFDKLKSIGEVRMDEENGTLEVAYKCFRSPLSYLALTVEYKKIYQDRGTVSGAYKSGEVFEVIGNMRDNPELLEKEANEIRQAKLDRDRQEYYKLQEKVDEYNNKSKWYRFCNKV